MGGSLTDTPRYPSISFGHTVGEFGGELQHPPESLRKGRRCLLTEWMALDDSEYDDEAQLFVTYLEPRHPPEDWLEDQIEEFFMSKWRPVLRPSWDSEDYEDWYEEVDAAYNEALESLEDD